MVIVEKVRTSKPFRELARIVETYPGAHGIVRACLVKEQNGALVKRPAQKLYLLEIRESKPKAREDVANGRRRRRAGSKARIFMNEMKPNSKRVRSS